MKKLKCWKKTIISHKPFDYNFTKVGKKHPKISVYKGQDNFIRTYKFLPTKHGVSRGKTLYEGKSKSQALEIANIYMIKHNVC